MKSSLSEKDVQGIYDMHTKDLKDKVALDVVTKISKDISMEVE